MEAALHGRTAKSGKSARLSDHHRLPLIGEAAQHRQPPRQRGHELGIAVRLNLHSTPRTSEEAAKTHGLTPRARISGMASAGVEPRVMGIPRCRRYRS